MTSFHLLLLVSLINYFFLPFQKIIWSSSKQNRFKSINTEQVKKGFAWKRDTETVLRGIMVSISGADPGFSLEGAPTLQGGGANLWFCQKFQKNCMKLRKFWTPGAPFPLLHLHCIVLSNVNISNCIQSNWKYFVMWILKRWFCTSVSTWNSCERPFITIRIWCKYLRSMVTWW